MALLAIFACRHLLGSSVPTVSAGMKTGGVKKVLRQLSTLAASGLVVDSGLSLCSLVGPMLPQTMICTARDLVFSCAPCSPHPWSPFWWECLSTSLGSQGLRLLRGMSPWPVRDWGKQHLSLFCWPHMVGTQPVFHLFSFIMPCTVFWTSSCSQIRLLIYVSGEEGGALSGFLAPTCGPALFPSPCTVQTA